MTRQNAAMVEESTVASTSLAQDAQQLAALMARFTVAANAAVKTWTPRAPFSEQKRCRA